MYILKQCRKTVLTDLLIHEEKIEEIENKYGSQPPLPGAKNEPEVLVFCFAYGKGGLTVSATMIRFG